MAQAGRLEPRGFDEQWAANAAEIEQWRSVDHGTARELRDVVAPRRPHEDSRRNKGRARRIWFTVIAGGLCVGSLLLYLLITLSGIGLPKELTRQAEVPTKAVPVDAKRELSRSAGGAQMTLDQRREAERRAAEGGQRNAIRQARLNAAIEAPHRKEQAWQRFYQPSENCQANASRGTIACANEHARAKMEFEKRWSEGRL